MNKALQAVLVLALRERGFYGRMPNFCRPGLERADYLHVQYRRAGGSFAVNIAKTGGADRLWDEDAKLPINKLTVAHFRERLRLGSNPGTGPGPGRSDHWFEYGRRSYYPASAPKPDEHYRNIAEQVVSYLGQAEDWWRDPLT